LYGDTFDVVARTNANNIAYTTEALVPHQDLAYYESQPGLQLLHCVANNADTVIGGESTLVDVLAAATHFQTLAPDLFRVLTSVEATFIKQRQNADMVFRGPCITVDSSDNVVGVRWSPPFEGPVCTERAEDFFVAKAAFELMVDNAIPSDRLFGGSLLDEKLQQKLRQYASDYTWEYRLQPGDLLVFNNQRMLHGRRGFTLKANARDGDRHLIGCYTNMEETLNRYRLHRRPRLVEGRLSMRYHHNAGNNSGGD
jgi:gamma-butyrobetaine dioxygenase